ncbi:MAG: polar amino acid transport system ATP-binding protein, partial [Chloroflexota bacterium]|nr:polar amino acid transport system ATP-binding protein [Chloroflexota bacterium]
MPSDPIITFENVNKFFGRHQVLNDISFKIWEGEVVVVFGPSGGGKSTMIRCINRLEPISSGRIIVDGIQAHDPRTDINRLRAEVGMVFQHFNLFPHLSVLRNITLAQIKVRKRSKEEAERIARDLLV